MGKSDNVLIPGSAQVQPGPGGEVKMEGADGVRAVPQPRKQSRKGWAEASKAIAAAGDDMLVMGEFANAIDRELAT